MTYEQTPLWGDISLARHDEYDGEGFYLSREFEIVLGAATNRGGRSKNEDEYLMHPTIVCLSDGIWGGGHGELMSKFTCRALADEWERLEKSGLESDERMRLALARTDEFVSRVSSYFNGEPGATVVAVARSAGDDLVFGAVGDSRAYLLKGGELLPVFDSLGRESRGSNRLSAALGYGMLRSGRLDASVSVISGDLGDKLVLCTDGVWTTVAEDEMAAKLRESSNPYYVANALVAKAVEAAGPVGDNATAVVGALLRAGGSSEATPVGPILACAEY